MAVCTIVMAMEAVRSLWSSNWAAAGAGSAKAQIKAHIKPQVEVMAMAERRSLDNCMRVAPIFCCTHLAGSPDEHKGFSMRRQDLIAATDDVFATRSQFAVARRCPDLTQDSQKQPLLRTRRLREPVANRHSDPKSNAGLRQGRFRGVRLYDPRGQARGARGADAPVCACDQARGI